MMSTLLITMYFEFAQEVPQSTDYIGQLDSILTLK